MIQQQIPLGSRSQRRDQDAINNSWQGDAIPVMKPENTIRLMFHNVNNIPLQGTISFDTFVQSQIDLQVDIQSFSEHCLDTTKFTVLHKAQSILARVSTQMATLQLDSSNEPAPHIFKPGGTGILTIGKAASRLVPRGKGGDSLGRWSFMSFRRRHFPPVTVISIYQVCPRPTNTIGNTSYHQQQRALAMQDRHVHPRQAFMEDLHQFVHSLLEQQHDIILGGDFNESLSDRNSGILQLASRLQLVDPFQSRFPNKPEFGTHLHGKRRIDSVFVTTGMIPGIRSIGYAPYDSATPSDHRPLILDINSSVFFGTDAAYMVTPSNRILRAKDKASVQKYVNTLHAYLLDHHAYRIIPQLQDNTATPEMVEAIDNLLGVGEELAEKACRKRRPEYYSQTIVRQRIEVTILKQHLRALRLEQDRTNQLRIKMDRAGINIELPLTISHTKAALNEAKARLIKTRQTSFETRQAELDKRIQELSDQHNRSKHKILSAIRKVENNLQTYRILKAMKKDHFRTNTIDRVEVPASWPQPTDRYPPLHTLEDPKSCQEWKLVTDPNEVEFYLLLRNRMHFGQASGTPFTEPPLSTEINWQATTAMAEAILEGSHISITTNSQVQDLLTACTAAVPLDTTVPQELTFEEFRGKIKSWRESTTTSPSGRHLGRYKALFSPPPMTEDTHDTEHIIATFADTQETIARLKLAIINYCIRNTYVLERWKTVVNVMIFKEDGNYQIHRLRVIHLYEADFNAILAVKWRSLLRKAESTGILNEGQYGGRPGCEAQSLTLMEELKYDLSYLTRRTLFNFDNDATSCYDRIVVPVASLINRKYGQHRSLVSLHATTLQQARFRLKTNHGTTTSHYRHTEETPIHGTGQGSGNSPCIWLLISSTLFDIHQTQAHGCKFVTPCGQEKVTLSMVGFVDDSTGTSNDFQPQTQASLQEMCHRMQKDAQLWSDLLHCTGGKLELTKCSFHCLHFEFHPNGTPKPAKYRLNNHIFIRDAATQEDIPISAKTIEETHKTLGHFKAPYTRKHNLEHLTSKAHLLSVSIATSPITRSGANLAYHTIFIPTIRYTLPQSYYPRHLLDQAQAQSLNRIIAKCGYNRNTARAILFAPVQYGGGGFLPWHLLQGEGQIIHFLKHWRTDTLVSSILRMTVCWAQWQSGCSQSIFQNTTSRLPYLECQWIQSLRSFLSQIAATIRLDHTFVSRPERDRDIHIMDYASASGIFNDADLRIINYCRLYLHVTTVSEIFETDGQKLNSYVFHCHREPWFNPSTYVTLQQRPTEFHVRTKWQKLCRQWVQSSGEIAASMSLGKWQTSGENLRRRRSTYIETTGTSRVYHWRRGTYWEYRPSTDIPFHFHPAKPTSWTPTGPCYPLHAKIHTSGTIVIPRPYHATRATLLHDLTTPKTFHHYVNTLSPWEQHLLLGVDFKVGPYSIAHTIMAPTQSTTFFLVSDGSQVEDRITYGWVLGNSEGKTFVEHSGYGFGTATSHRAEAWGILSGVLFLHHLQVFTGQQFLQNQRTQFTIWSDNSGLIHSLQQRQQYPKPFPNSTLVPDWDLLEQIQSLTKPFSPANFTFSWVRGHQDDQDEEISSEALYNIRADHLASLVHAPPDTKSSPWTLPAERCTLVVQGQTVHAHYQTIIRREYTLPPLREYLATRHGWTSQTLTTIDWPAYHQAISTMAIPRHQLTKLIFDKLPTNYELSKSNKQLAPECHFCGEVETFRHFLRCDNPESQEFRAQLSEQLAKYLTTHDVPPRFTHLLLKAIARCISFIPHDLDTPTQSISLFNSQRNIGWELMPKGFWTLEWRNTLEKEIRLYTAESTTPALLIIAGIIRLMWNLQYEMWTKICQRRGNLHEQQSLRSTTKRVEYATRIRILHDQRDKCLHQHRHVYFHDDVNRFIDQSTTLQLKQYLLLYEPVIEKSIRDAKVNPARTLLQFVGFTSSRYRQPAHHPTGSGNSPQHSPNFQNTRPLLNNSLSEPPPPNPDSDYPQIPRAKLRQNPVTEGTFPHKHSRWKTLPALRTLRDYFNLSTPHPPANS